MTAQEIYNQVATHLLTQKARSENDQMCLYRDPQGRKCAAGCLIPDELYDPFFENIFFTSIIERKHSKFEVATPEVIAKTDKLKEMFGEHGDLILSLQSVHDMRNPGLWKMSLKEVGEKYKLSTEVLCGLD